MSEHRADIGAVVLHGIWTLAEYRQRCLISAIGVPKNMKCLNRISTVLLAGLLATTIGCSTISEVIVEAAIDSVLETSEDREIRTDYKRLSNDKPLKHHRNERDLFNHDIQRVLWDDDGTDSVSGSSFSDPKDELTVKLEFPLSNQSLDFAPAPGTFRVIFYNDTNIKKHPASRIGIKIDGKGVEAPPSGQYVQIDLPPGEYKLELIHRDVWDFHHKYRLKVEDQNVYMRLYRTIFSAKFKSSHEEPMLLRTAFKPIANSNP